MSDPSRRAIVTAFTDLCRELHLKDDERIALIWYLGQIRLRNTVETLLKLSGENKDA